MIGREPRDVPEPWSPADATDCLRELGASDDLDFLYTQHARDQWSERGLLTGDVLFLLTRGFVHEAPEEASHPEDRETFWKYQIQGMTPNSGHREVRAVVIPDAQRTMIKVVTVMWVDEPLLTNTHIDKRRRHNG